MWERWVETGPWVPCQIERSDAPLWLVPAAETLHGARSCGSEQRRGATLRGGGPKATAAPSAKMRA